MGHDLMPENLELTSELLFYPAKRGFPYDMCIYIYVISLYSIYICKCIHIITYTYIYRSIKSFRVSHRHFSGEKLSWNHKLPSFISHILISCRCPVWQFNPGQIQGGCWQGQVWPFSAEILKLNTNFPWVEGYHCNKRNGFSTVQFSGGSGSQSWSCIPGRGHYLSCR